MNIIHCIVMVLILTTFTIAKAPPIDVVFFIQSQDTKYHNELSRNLKEDISKQSVELQSKYRIRVYVIHELFDYPGDWTIHNLIPKLWLLQRNRNINTNMEMKMSTSATNTNQQIEDIINDNTRWIVFCEERTNVKLKLLMEKLNKENHIKPLYLGHALHDSEPTIIHHFAFFENPKWFPYPMLSAGVVFSMPLFKSIADISINHNSNKQRSEFSVDAAHELSRYIYDNLQISSTKTSTTLKNIGNGNKTRTSTSSTNDSDLTHYNFHTATTTTISNENLDNSKVRTTTDKNTKNRK